MTNNGPTVQFDLSLRKGAASPFTLGSSVLAIAAGATADITITPKAIPTNLINVNDITDTIDLTPEAGDAGAPDNRPSLSIAVAITPQGAIINFNSHAATQSVSVTTATTTTTSIVTLANTGQPSGCAHLRDDHEPAERLHRRAAHDDARWRSNRLLEHGHVHAPDEDHERVHGHVVGDGRYEWRRKLDDALRAASALCARHAGIRLDRIYGQRHVTKTRLFLAASLALLLGTAARTASAEDSSEKGGPRVHALLGLSHAIGAPQGGDFGFGGAGALTAELPLLPWLSVEALGGTMFLVPNDPPPGVPKKSTGTISTFTAGVRLHPLPKMGPNGPWIGGGAGLAISGPDARFGADGMLGWDFGLGAGAFVVGPFVAYTHVLEPGTTKQDEADAHVLWGGVHVSLGRPRARHREEEAPIAIGPDADGDGVADADDACPSVKGEKTSDINTNGCPAGDKDGDGIPNGQDACPESKGEKNADPKLNGCPPAPGEARTTIATATRSRARSTRAPTNPDSRTRIRS